MLKSVLIALATLVSFDAVAWRGAIRGELVREARAAVAAVGALNWNWG